MLDSLVLRDMLVAVSVVNETKVSDGAGLPRADEVFAAVA